MRVFIEEKNMNEIVFPTHVTDEMPKELWLELTSKCPFDCVFCSRKLLRGKGQHMDFEVYKKIINLLDSPRIIRLNYSGESVHYPKLIEAIKLAKSTGAVVELVSAFSSIKKALIEQLVKADLDRLSVSIHTVNERQYQSIYGFGDVESLKERLSLLRYWQRETGLVFPSVDIAFVAMDQNIDQMVNVCQLAEEFKINQIDVHPIIRRDDIPEKFEKELSKGKLRTSFLQKMEKVVKDVGSLFPDIKLNYSTPEYEKSNSCQVLSSNPSYFPWKLPLNAKIWSCDQSPWETVHVLANGDVVTCEVRDQVIMGNVHEQSLKTIWTNEKYSSFRQKYINATDSACNTCVYKRAYIPKAIEPHVGPESFNVSQLLSGWYDAETNLVWSHPVSKVVVARLNGKHLLKICGLIPPVQGKKRVFEVSIGDELVGFRENKSDQFEDFQLEIALKGEIEQIVEVGFKISPPYSPSKEDGSEDSRLLGFALFSINWLD